MPRDLTLSEIEGLSYYDFMGYLNVPFFNVGGTPSLDLLAERCGIGPGSHVLDVGCGTGTNALYLAERYGCRVTGVDISEQMVERAKEKAVESGLGDLLEFSVGDAYALDYPDETFDAVVTVFVSQFLDPGRVFAEFMRVLRVEGWLGVNEMSKADNIPANLVSRVDEGEAIFKELTELPFDLRTPLEWESGLADAGFQDVEVEYFDYNVTVSASLGLLKEMGGLGAVLSYLWKVLRLGLMSGKMREKFARISRGKGILINDPSSSKYIGYVIGVGRKG